MKSRRDFLIDCIIDYLKERVDIAEDLCGTDDENYITAKKAYDDMCELKEIIEVTA